MYRIRSTGEIKSKDEIIAANPNTSFPKVWSPELVENLELDPVFETPAPTTTRYQTAYKDGVKQVNGKWVWDWEIAEMEDEAKAAIDAAQASAVRSDRDRRLADTDWTQVADAPVDKTAWATYRQALRDVPGQPGFPWDVQWPSQPE